MVTGSNGGALLLDTDVAVDLHSSPSMLRVFIRWAKADPSGKGVILFLGRTHKSQSQLSVLNYMAVCLPGEGPLLRWGDSSSLTQDQFIGAIKSVLAEAYMDPSPYSGHGFRIGAAISAAAAGVPNQMIKLLGRWQSEAYQFYICTPQECLVSVSTQLATLQSSI